LYFSVCCVLTWLARPPHATRGSEDRLCKLRRRHKERESPEGPHDVDDRAAIESAVINFFERHPRVVRDLLQSARSSRPALWRVVAKEDPATAAPPAEATAPANGGEGSPEEEMPLEAAAAAAAAAPAPPDPVEVLPLQPGLCALCEKHAVTAIDESRDGVAVFCAECTDSVSRTVSWAGTWEHGPKYLRISDSDDDPTVSALGAPRPAESAGDTRRQCAQQ